MKDPDLPREETFMSHLVELRARLVKALWALFLVFIPLFFFRNDLYELLALPMLKSLPQGSNMIATGVVTSFFIPIKVALMVAFIGALPFVLYQAWAFVAPGLYAHERRIALPLIVGSTVLFIIGMAFCYFFVFRTVFTTIAEWAPKTITLAPDIENYISFVMTMFLAFGCTFEVPIVVIVLVMMGIVDVAKLKEIRPYVIVGAFIVAAVVTPPDVLSQLLLAVPMCLLYELGIFLARFVKKQTQPVEDNALTTTPPSSPT